MTKHALEDQLTELTREFVSKLVEAIRNASFAEVAALPSARSSPARAEPRAPRVVEATSPGAARQTAEGRAAMGDRVLQVLGRAGRPLGVRALAAELSVAPDRLAAPLKDLRAAGRIRKQGDKRATTYTVV